MIKMKTNVKPGKTPAEITVSMIDQDLKDGISKPEMAIKYGIKPWEVDEMFKHPDLKGRRPSRKKSLSFTFVDDTEPEFAQREESTQFPNSMADVTEEVDPNQVTLEQAIDEAIETAEEVKSQMQETQEAIVDMLSPTEFETEITGIPNGDTISDTDDDLTLPTLEDTLELVEEQKIEARINEVEMPDDALETVIDSLIEEIEIEEDDDTFEL